MLKKMRSEQEMYDLILGIARQDERVRAVYMNGSRTNKNVPRDRFQDYDIVYVVDETKSFIEDRKWILKFGEILYMQYPDESPFEKADKENNYGWLMQFTDGNRMDLTVQTVAFTQEHIHEDRLCVVLLDKDHLLDGVAPSSDEKYRVKKPTRDEYLAVCNEFWWCTNNVAKGLWRREMLYVQNMVHDPVRMQLIQMLNWKAGAKNDWNVSTGKSAKYLYRYLPREDYSRLLATYFGGDTEQAWEAVFAMCEFFAEKAREVGTLLGYAYNEREGEAAYRYLRDVYESREENHVQ